MKHSMTFMRALSLGSAFFLIFFVTACQTAASTTADVAKNNCIDQTPLPEPMSVTPPGGDVSDEISRFSGMWSNGKWDNKLCATLVVTSVDAAGNAKAIYSHGTYSGWDIRQPEYSYHSGKITDGKLTLETFSNDADVSYWFSDDKLMGSYTKNGTSYVTLTKITQ